MATNGQNLQPTGRFGHVRNKIECIIFFHASVLKIYLIEKSPRLHYSILAVTEDGYDYFIMFLLIPTWVIHTTVLRVSVIYIFVAN